MHLLLFYNNLAVCLVLLFHQDVESNHARYEQQQQLRFDQRSPASAAGCCCAGRRQLIMKLTATTTSDQDWLANSNIITVVLVSVMTVVRSALGTQLLGLAAWGRPGPLPHEFSMPTGTSTWIKGIRWVCTTGTIRDENVIIWLSVFYRFSLTANK